VENFSKTRYLYTTIKFDQPEGALLTRQTLKKDWLIILTAIFGGIAGFKDIIEFILSKVEPMYEKRLKEQNRSEEEKKQAEEKQQAELYKKWLTSLMCWLCCKRFSAKCRPCWEKVSAKCRPCWESFAAKCRACWAKVSAKCCKRNCVRTEPQNERNGSQTSLK